MDVLERLQDNIQTSETLLNEEFDDYTQSDKTSSSVDKNLSKTYSTQVNDDIIIVKSSDNNEISNEDTMPKTDTDASSHIHVITNAFFECSTINCKKSFIDEECNECIIEFQKHEMHFCEDHVLHSIHRNCIGLLDNNNKDTENLKYDEAMEALITLGSATESKDSRDDDDEDENNNTNNDLMIISEAHNFVHKLLKSIPEVKKM